jgi:cyclopropane fatty-acyl-phospholipid synthase-like methyltransferase
MHNIKLVSTLSSRISTLAVCTLLAAGCGHGHHKHQGHGPKSADAAHLGETAHKEGGHGGHHRFDDPEAWSARWEGAERDANQKPAQVVARCGVEPGMTAVDLGTGTGYFVPHLSRAVGPDGRVLALDIEQSMVDWVAQRATKEGLSNVTATRVAMDDPGLGDDSVDRVLIVNTWHHIESRPAYLEKLRAALRPNGRLCIVELTMDAPHGPPKKHRLSPEVLAAELSAGGFLPSPELLELPHQYLMVATPTAPAAVDTTH